MNAPTIEFFWDAASPYSYLAATQIDALAGRVGAAVRWRPFLLGKVFEACGNRMPAAVPAKGKYLFQDLQLWSRFYGVPLRFPKKFPTNSLLAQRVACAAEPGPSGPQLARAVMRAYWADGQDIEDAAILARLCDGLGLPGAGLIEAAGQQPVKDLLRANTEEAVRRGAFGAPSFFVGERMFWGNDRLPLMEAMLAGRLAA
ncbi:MAG: 2-hydroxychromene-2-carboxylate isomerase [Gammaproteobacteria bacterium]|nr:2-hydroxychromene-2-carboxylate isomerase [Gammaproteobacteria bacterium]